MVDFPKKQATADKGNGPTFLSKARQEHDELFARFLANQEEYGSVEEYTDALAAQAWEMTEAIAKQSYRNGIARGRRGRGKRHGDR